MFKEYEMQKHFEREQKLKQMTDEEREKFLAEEKKVETEREIKQKLDPVCIRNVNMNNYENVNLNKHEGKNIYYLMFLSDSSSRK